MVDPRELIVTDEHFTCARRRRWRRRARRCATVCGPLLSAGKVVVTGGFVGATRSGVATTLGRGGSDYSAAILGAALDAAEIQIWTDVDGMLTADPRVVENRHASCRALSFAEAAELAYFGAKVLHPKTHPAGGRRATSRCGSSTRSSRRPAGRSSPNAGAPDPSPVTALACKKGITVITITSTGMLMAYGYMRRIFEVFERFRTSVDVVSTSEVSVSVTIDDRHASRGHRRGAVGVCRCQRRERAGAGGRGGRRVRRRPAGVFSRVVRALEGIPLRLVSQADARRNVTLVIDEDDLPRAMGQLHAEFFRPAPQTLHSRLGSERLNMDLRQLEILKAVAETGSFTGAGRRLHVSQSAISRQILLLEAELNEPLFWRIKRKVKITPAGEALLQLSIRVFDDIRETTDRLSETQQKLTGTIRLVGGMTVSIYVFPTLLKEFQRLHPDVDVKVMTGPADRLVRRLRAGTVDLGLLTLPVSEPDLITRPVMREELQLVTYPAHPMAQKKRVETAGSEQAAVHPVRAG